MDNKEAIKVLEERRAKLRRTAVKNKSLSEVRRIVIETRKEIQALSHAIEVLKRVDDVEGITRILSENIKVPKNILTYYATHLSKWIKGE